MPVSLAAVATREVFGGLSSAERKLWYALAVLSVLVFAYGVARPIAKYARGQRGGLPRRGELVGRFRWAVGTLLSHASIRSRDPLVGWAHRGIFYGFVTLTLGTIILGINTDVTEPLFGWRFFQGDFYLVYSLVLDLLGLALVVGLAVMIVRRGILRPAKLDYRRADGQADERRRGWRGYRGGDWVFLLSLLYLGVTGFVLEGVRIAMDHPGYNAFSPVGWAASLLFGGMSFGQLHDLRGVLWWSHGIVALILVASIPYTKAMHMLVSFTSLVLRDPSAGKRLVPIPDAKALDPAGYGVLTDFTVTHLLQLDACTKCGKCHEACPPNATGRPLSPRDVILDLREQSNDELGSLGVGGVLATLRRNPSELQLPEVVGGDGIKPETIWACMQCNACVEACPVGIEQAPIINQIRRRMVEEGDLDSSLAGVLQTIQKSGNSFGENRRKRGRWTADLDFEVADARTQPVELLWFVGDYASFDPRSQRVTRALARLLKAAGVDFGILYDAERNSGNDVRRVGEEGLYVDLAENNISTLSECTFTKVMTSDPHSLNTLRNEYPEFGGAWSTVHHTAVLLDLIETGALQLSHGLGRRVTYHDPCYLGRHNGEYDAPREILRKLGCELVEMPRNRSNSFCCGAGGGQIWVPDTPGTERPSENRIREALGLGALDYFVVACPKDVTMYEDAIKTSGSSDRIELREITELVVEAVGLDANMGQQPVESGHEPASPGTSGTGDG